MYIIPAIDIKSGQCVRLYQGSFDAVTTYAVEPLERAQQYAAAGATHLHLVDLDGAKQGKIVHLELIKNICDAKLLRVQVGGGIRDKETIKKLFEIGVAGVVIGSMAISQPDIVKTWLTEFGAENIILALDVFVGDNEPMLATHGWQQRATKSLWQLLDEYQETQLQHVLCTDINCDGTLKGPNLNLYQQMLERYPHLQIQASGGISAVGDLVALAELGVAATIVGKALYENKFSYSDAVAAVHVC